MHRYPEDTVATADDLRTSRWKDAVASNTDRSYSGVWQALSKAAASAMDEGRAAESKALWLLADASSMMLKPKSINEPFTPMEVFGERRSAVPSDFTTEDMDLFQAVASELDDDLLRARICDLVWLCASPRNPEIARIAIDAYRSIPLTSESWSEDARDCWERAIAMCLQLRSGAGSRLEELEASLLTIFSEAVSSDVFFALSLARLLLEHDLGRTQAVKTAESLAKRGTELAQTENHHETRCLFETSAQWYGRAKDNALQADMICATAETWAKEALARASGSQPSNSVAANFYENAIQTYRKVPRNLRMTRHVDKRLAELYVSLKNAREASTSEMSIISSGPVDISDMVEAARATVRGRDFNSALLALANIHRGANKSKIMSCSEESLRRQPLQALFASTHLSKDGRVVAKRPGGSFGNSNSQEHQLTLWSEMVKHYSFEIGLIVQGLLLPALDIVSLEHRVRESDLTYIVGNSPIVPHDRVGLFAKGLFAGFERDFVTALHILVPQVENLVRWHLKAAGVKTTTLSPDGIENENGLSTLVELPEVTYIFGEDNAFEIRALFCDPFGPNLRNEVAHGLLDDSNCLTAQTIYAWWLVLRLTFITFLNASRKSQSHAQPTKDPVNDGTVNEA